LFKRYIEKEIVMWKREGACGNDALELKIGERMHVGRMGKKLMWQ